MAATAPSDEAPVPEDRHRRRCQLVNVLLQELNNWEEEERCIEKYHSMVRLSQSNTNNTISTFIEAIVDSNESRKLQTDDSQPPIIVKLPKGSSISRISAGYKQKKTLSAVTQKISASLKHAKSSTTSSARRFRRYSKAKKQAAVKATSINTPRHNPDSTLDIRNGAATAELLEREESNMPQAKIDEALVVTNIAIEGPPESAVPFHSRNCERDADLASTAASADNQGFDQNEHEIITYQLQHESIKVKLKTGEEIYYLAMSSDGRDEPEQCT